jgi:hypothetical protein
VTEGQIHCLRLVKRQGYWRASFRLLQQRVLCREHDRGHLGLIAHPCQEEGKVGYRRRASLGPQSPVDRVLLRSASHCSRVITGGLPIPQPMQHTLSSEERSQMHVMSLATRLFNS